jgi:methyl-accepting chemotaxis protein
MKLLSNMSIKFRLIAMSTLLITIVLIAKGVYDYKVVKSSLLVDANKSITLVSERLKLNLPAALWMDLSEQVIKIGTSELETPYIYGIEIKTSDGEVKYAEENEGSKGEEFTFPLIHSEYGEESTVGSLVISIDLKTIEHKTNDALINIIIGVVLVDILLVFILFFLSRVIVTNPLNQVIIAVTDIAQGEGDLTKRLNIKTQDEIGELADQINYFINKTQEMVKTIITTTQVISDTSISVKSDVSNVNVLFEKQYIEIDLLATAITEMAASTKDISLTSELSSDSAFQAKEQANEVGLVIDKSMVSVNGLSSDLENATKVISELSSTVDNMASVIDVIKSIAEQTNLLALNAAIEAARAGEQGRGFAVVADEVRALASRTQQSTEEISHMIAELQRGTSSAVIVVQDSKIKGENTTEVMHNSVEYISKIILASDNISDTSLQIATSVKEQSNVTASLDVNINGIVCSGQESNKLINEINMKANQLDGHVNNLQALTSQFKV